jgi:hypothetical protein
MNNEEEVPAIDYDEERAAEEPQADEEEDYAPSEENDEQNDYDCKYNVLLKLELSNR